ncbi:MAG: MBL fold metallo-hydrolase [Solirubrobacteraceae bacterium]|jgi:glyoxylase-like metal-dependent hydrolase (beta-lactamase superfamily II)
MRAVALHRDVLLARSALLQLNCVIVRGPAGEQQESPGPGESAGEPAGEAGGEAGGESFLIDSPLLPEELDALPSLLEQARFPAPSGLLATHGDWDHLLGRFAFPGLALGCAQSTAERLNGSPGEAQRDLRAFDEGLMIVRDRPLALGSLQGLPVPGRLDIGSGVLELHPADGHTPDGMAVLIGWSRVLVVGDYLSALELPTFSDGGDPEAYLETLARLRPLLARAEHVVPGHGPVLNRARALGLLEEDAAYLQALRQSGIEAELPASRRGAAQRRVHGENVAALQ